MSTVIVAAKKAARLIKNVHEINDGGRPRRVTVTYHESVTANLLAFLEGGATLPSAIPVRSANCPRTPARPHRYQEVS